MRPIRISALALGFALLACSPQQQAEATPSPAADATAHPVSGLRVVPLTVRSLNGEHAFRVEVAETPAEQARGLMFRTELAPDEGMIFPYDPPRQASFWMKNTPLPLDILYIGTDRRISNIAAMTTPYSLEPMPSVGAASLVLEIPGGRAGELGIAPGDKVEW